MQQGTYTRLANAIIRQAACDYLDVKWLIYQLDTNQYNNQTYVNCYGRIRREHHARDEFYNDLVTELDKIIKFFHSNWYGVLSWSNADYLMMLLDDELNRWIRNNKRPRREYFLI